jgi:hypothetical protein
VPGNLLIQGLQHLAEQAGRRIRLENESVIVTLLEEYGSLPDINEYLQTFGFATLSTLIKDVWHRRFQQSLRLVHDLKTQTRVLCAFGGLLDRLYSLDQKSMDALEDWCLKHGLNATSQTAGNPANELFKPADIVAALGAAFRSKGLKPVVKDPKLRKALREAFPLKPSSTSLGGASATIAETLAQLGVRARVYTMYHSPEQASAYSPPWNTTWVDLSSDPPEYPRASAAGKDDHPTRVTYVLAYSDGLRLNSQSVTASRTDRCLLRVMPFVGRKLRSFSVGRRAVDIPVDGEWPSVTGFVRWKITNKVRVSVEFVDAPLLKQLASEHHYVVLNSPGIGQLQKPEEPEAKMLLRQLRTLAEAGASIHLEISGGADPKYRIRPFADSLSGVVRIMGINDEELSQVAALRDYPAGLPPLPPASAPEVYRRYVQALRLAKTLKLDRLYVHGNDVDLLLRRSASEAGLQLELQAGLFTKGAVIVSLLLRNGRDPLTVELPRALYHEGFRALIQFAFAFARAKPALDKPAQRDLFERIVADGYFLETRNDEYSVALIPVMWPEVVAVDPSINTTGAGDICSGIDLVYSGWR